MASCRIKLFDHPLHPILLLIAFALYTGTPLAFIAYFLTEVLLWFKLGVITSIAGVSLSLLVTLPGFIDLAMGTPDDKQSEKKTSLFHILAHMTLNLASILLFTASVLYTLPDWNSPSPEVELPLLITLSGMVTKLGAVYFGWKLVSTQLSEVEVPMERETAANTDESRKPARRTAY